MNSVGEETISVGTFGYPSAPAVEAIGRRLIESGLGNDSSLLTPGEHIWTLTNLEKLKADYVDKPDASKDGFFDKLSRQLGGASPAVIQLYAELLILNVLPITNVGGERKLKQVEYVLKLSADPVTLPDDVRATLLGGGVFNGGQAFTSYRWAQIAYLIQLAIHFKNIDSQRRSDALGDPLLFRDEVDAVPSGQSAQRYALLYQAFPQFFLPVVNVNDRAGIRDRFADEYLPEPSDDLDLDLSRIYDAFSAAAGHPVNLRAEWEKSKAVQHAWKVQGSNVKGQDMVPIWHTKHSVSLAASLLRAVDDSVEREELKSFVDEDYKSSGYAARQEKLDEFYLFLKRMHPGDLVITISQGRIHFGTITGAA